MGGVFSAQLGFSPADDHNLNADAPAALAALAALNAGMPTLFVPGDVTVQTFLLDGHLTRLRRGDALCQALAMLTDRWAPILRQQSSGLRAGQVAALHDPLTVACMVKRRFVKTANLRVTVALHDGLVRTFVDPVAGADAEVVTAVDAEGFADYLLDALLI
ncbi:MAG: nucleoside hydrolase [Actinomycetota bacterium]|nr:nucleoside hydrolase [Actinomycetota bacterium]